MFRLLGKVGLITALGFSAAVPSVAAAKEWGRSGQWKINHSSGWGCNILSNKIAGGPANSERYVLIGYNADPPWGKPVTVYVTNFASVAPEKSGEHVSTLSFGRSSAPLVSGKAQVVRQSSTDLFAGFKFFTSEDVLGAIEENERVSIAVPALGISEAIALPGMRAAIPKLRECAEDARKK